MTRSAVRDTLTILDDSEQYLRAREAKAMCDHVWIFEARTLGGSAFSPRAAAYRPSDFSVISGASFRMVLDVGNWDQSVTINTPGQSGDPYSPHYRDLAPLWAGGDYAPLLYSRAAVEHAASEVFRLMPVGR
jgi:acyl-homoserine lactone acylase PvdQ